MVMEQDSPLLSLCLKRNPINSHLSLYFPHHQISSHPNCTHFHKTASINLYDKLHNNKRLLMSAKYRDRLLQSSGVSNIRFESEYAKKLMKQMGWKEGNGLGKNQHGSTDCVQVKRREDNLGLGKKTLGGETNWKDEWWNDAYNNSIKKLNVLPEKFKKKQRKEKERESSCSSSSDDSSDDSSNSSDPGMPSLFAKKHKHIKKTAQKKQSK